MTIVDLDDALAHVTRPARVRLVHGMAAMIPPVAVTVALVVGAVLIAIEGVDPRDVYGTVVRYVVTSRFGWRDVLVEAVPLTIIGLGLSIAYRAQVFTIGAEGQYLVGATAATAVVTVPGFAGAPGVLLIAMGLVVAVVAGALWSAISAVLWSRVGTSVVISSLLLNYVAAAVLAWSIRTVIRDPDGFVPQSRPLGSAVLGDLPWFDVHVGVALLVIVVPVLGVGFARSRWGYLVDVHGHNAEALDAHEMPRRRVVFWALAACGALAGLAGFVQTSGVSGRLTADAGLGYGFTAIVVAVLGRLRPAGVVLAALALSAMTIGFEAAEREYGIPASLAAVVQAVIVLAVVVGDGTVARWGTRA